MVRNDFDRLLIYELLKNLGFSLIGLFIPVHLYTEGLGFTIAVGWVLVSGLTYLCCSWFVASLIDRIGYKHSLIASYLFILPGLAAIHLLPLSLPAVIIIGLTYHIGRLFHDIGKPSEFTTDSSEKNRSKDSGKLLSIPMFSRVLGPFLGGVIFAWYGFPALLGTSLIVLAISTIPLLQTPDHSASMHTGYRAIITTEWNRYIPLFVIRGIQGASAVALFGLFVFIFVGGEIDVGGVHALDTLGFILTGLLVGYLGGKQHHTLLVSIGGLGEALLFGVRGLVGTPLWAFVVSFISGLFFQLYHVPLFADFADAAENTDILEFFTLRKVFIGFGELLTAVLTILVAMRYDTKTGFLAAFGAGAVASVGMVLLYHHQDS